MFNFKQLMHMKYGNQGCCYMMKLCEVLMFGDLQYSEITRIWDWFMQEITTKKNPACVALSGGGDETPGEE